MEQLLVVEDDAPTAAFLRDNLEADGFEVAGAGGVDEAVRALQVLVLSGRSAELDRLRGFARGADDYLVKPFSYAELVARVRALLRRARGRPRAGVIRIGRL